MVKFWNSTEEAKQRASREISALKSFSNSKEWDQKPYSAAADVTTVYFASEQMSTCNSSDVSGAIAITHHPRRYTTFEGALSHGTTFTHVPGYISKFLLNGVDVSREITKKHGDDDREKVMSFWCHYFEQFITSNEDLTDQSKDSTSSSSPAINELREITSREIENNNSLVKHLQDSIRGDFHFTSFCHGNLEAQNIYVRPLTKKEHDESMEDREFYGKGTPVTLAAPVNQYPNSPLWVDLGSFLATIFRSYVASCVREQEARCGRMALVKPIEKEEGEKKVRKYVVYWQQKSGYAAHMLTEKASMWNHMRTYLAYLLQETFNDILDGLIRDDTPPEAWQTTLRLSCQYAAILMLHHGINQTPESDAHIDYSPEFDSPPDNPDSVLSKAGQVKMATGCCKLARELHAEKGTNAEGDNTPEAFTQTVISSYLQYLDQHLFTE